MIANTKRKSKSKNAPEAIEQAAAYFRKSQKAKRKTKDGKKESQESSIERQTELADRYCRRNPTVTLSEENVFVDAGVRGWKRGEDRKGWRNMLAAAQEGRFSVILVENIDRFSRATVGDVWEDANKLKAAGVTKIIETGECGAVYDLGEDEEIGAIIRFVVAVWSANEFSRKLSLRISETRRKKAKEGVRSAGPAAYGYENDGKGGLLKGDPAKVAIVRHIFLDFASGKPMHAIARELNERGVKSPRGGRWAKDTIKEMVQRRVYLGEFRYGDIPCGQFHRLNGDGEIVRADEADDAAAIVVPNAHPAIIDADTFDRCARRLDRMKNHGQRDKGDTNLLSGILRCPKCGSPMNAAGARKPNGTLLYRCAKYIRFGLAGCDSHSISEGRILPYIIDLATKELAKLEMLFAPSEAPEELTAPVKVRQGKLADLQAERAEISEKLDAAVENCLFADASLRQRADKIIAKLRKEEARLDAEIEALREIESLGNKEHVYSVEMQRLAEYQLRLQETLLHVETNGRRVTCDRRKLRTLLQDMGCRVTLYFESRDVVCQSGRKMRKHVWTKGRFRLGLQEEEFFPRKTDDRNGGSCTQHYHVPQWGESALDALAKGTAPERVIADLLQNDPQREQRQLAIIDMAGRAAVHNPTQAPESSRYWSAMTGRFYCCQGNTLTGRNVVTEMARAYEDTAGSLADRLMAALIAADCAGGDHRGRLAAGIRIAKTGVDGYWLELNVDESDDAVIELAKKYAELKHEAKGAWRGGQLPFVHPCPDRTAPRPPGA